MKGKRKFRNVIAKILENFDVRVVLGDDFSYDPETRTVYFTPFTCSVDDFHRQWISDFFDFTVTERNYFLFSLLHEIGHHYTMESLTDEDLEYEILCRQALKFSDESDNRKNEAYFSLPSEIIATQWAIDFMKDYPRWCKKMTKRIYKALDKFGDINGWEMY